jgi:hypothetical protein
MAPTLAASRPGIPTADRMVALERRLWPAQFSLRLGRIAMASLSAAILPPRTRLRNARSSLTVNMALPKSTLVLAAAWWRAPHSVVWGRSGSV